MNAYATVTAPDTVRIERLLPGPIERVWDYLTDSEKRGRWLGSGNMELRAGGAMENVFNNSKLTENDDEPPAKYARMAGAVPVPGRVSACTPLQILAYTFGLDAEASEVTFELMPKGDKVLLVVTHRRISDRNAMLSYASGWHTHLDILADLLAERKPAGFWRTHTRLEAEYASRIAEA